jgi:hypothetical protein
MRPCAKLNEASGCDHCCFFAALWPCLQAVLRLLANAYVLHLMHLTSGGRIAAAAAQRLDLAALDALSFYQ